MIPSLPASGLIGVKAGRIALCAVVPAVFAAAPLNCGATDPGADIRLQPAQGKALPVEQLGVEAQKQYTGDGIR